MQNYTLWNKNRLLSEEVEASKTSVISDTLIDDEMTTLKKSELAQLSLNVSHQGKIYILEELSSSYLGSGQINAKGVDNIGSRIETMVGEQVTHLIGGGSIVPVEVGVVVQESGEEEEGEGGQENDESNRQNTMI
jgi:hypothetical protein